MGSGKGRQDASVVSVFYSSKKDWGDFPGGPVVKIPRFQCQGHSFHPWSESLIAHAATSQIEDWEHEWGFFIVYTFYMPKIPLQRVRHD